MTFLLVKTSRQNKTDIHRQTNTENKKENDENTDTEKKNEQTKSDKKEDDLHPYDDQQSETCMLINTFRDGTLTPLDMIYQAHERDKMVLENPLQPLLNRQSLPNGLDTYRMLGYLVGEESDEQWQLFGRESLRNKGEFYVRPTDKNKDVKITLTSDMMPKLRNRLKNIDDIPHEILIDHPLFNSNHYKVISLPTQFY